MRADTRVGPYGVCVRAVFQQSASIWPVTAILILALGLFSGCTGRAGLDAYRQRLVAATPVETTGPTVDATWFGTAAILLNDGQTKILIDPFVTRPGILKVGLGRPVAPDADLIGQWIQRLGAQEVSAVIVSHSHYDHAMDAPGFAQRSGAVLIGSESTANIGRGAGLPEQQIHVTQSGEVLTFGQFHLRLIPSEHGKALFGKIPYPGTIDSPLQTPSPADAYKLGTAYSIVIEHPAGILLHHASAGAIAGMFDGVRADIVLLGIAGRQDTATYLIQVVDAVGAHHVIPFHFDNFFRPLDEPISELWGVKLAEFFSSAAHRGARQRVATLPVGQPRRLLPID